jgi:hypothetical protein
LDDPADGRLIKAHALGNGLIEAWLTALQGIDKMRRQKHRRARKQGRADRRHVINETQHKSTRGIAPIGKDARQPLANLNAGIIKQCEKPGQHLSAIRLIERRMEIGSGQSIGRLDPAFTRGALRPVQKRIDNHTGGTNSEPARIAAGLR